MERQGREISLRIERGPIPVSKGLGVGLQLTSEIAPQIQVFGPNEKPSRRHFAAMFWWVLGGVRRVTPGLLFISEKLTQVVMVELSLAFQLHLSARQDLFYESGLPTIKHSVDQKNLSYTSTFTI